MTIWASFICYPAAGLGWILTWMALGLPNGLWAGYFYAACRDGELYFAVGALTAMPTFLLYYMIAALSNPHEPDPYGPVTVVSEIVCKGNYDYFLPDLATALLFHFWVLCETQELCLRIRVSAWSRIKRLMYLVGVPLVVVWGKNATPLNALYGALLGSASGVLMSALLSVVILPRLEDLSPCTRWAGFVHNQQTLALNYSGCHQESFRGGSNPQLL